MVYICTILFSCVCLFPCSEGEGAQAEPVVEDSAPAESVDVEDTSMGNDPTEPEVSYSYSESLEKLPELC